MKTLTNNMPGARGINLKGGRTLWIEPGQTVEVDEGDIVGAIPDLGEAAKAQAEGGVTADEIKALNERAELAEMALDEAQKELAAIKRSAPVVAAAVATLDHANDAHWTKPGEPAVDAVKAIVGGEVSRADIDAAAPGFNREAAKAQAGN